MADDGKWEPGSRVGPRTGELIQATLDVWPEHAKFLRASFGERSDDLLRTTETIAALLFKVAGGHGRPIRSYAEDYRHLCEVIVFPEEVFFRREGRYRLSTFAEAAEQVYNNAALMTRYMDGLFVSDALWLNHASAMNDFATLYLPHTKRGGRHLEIGPGHGMLLHLAVKHGAFNEMSAWDISETSIQHTRNVLQLVGQAGKVDLRLQDLYDSAARDEFAGRFDTIVLSEVLEHLEEPLAALEIIRGLLVPGGSVWINVPANGPAPDHLFLVRSPDEVKSLVERAGLSVARTAAYPIAGANLDRALRQELPISCVVVGVREAGK